MRATINAAGEPIVNAADFAIARAATGHGETGCSATEEA